MQIDRMFLHQIDMPYVTPFETSTEREYTRPCILVELHAEGLIGWGECVAGAGPWYAYETIGTAWHIINDVLAPLTLGQWFASPAALAERYAPVRGHAMARAAVEAALWDLTAQAQGVALATLIGGVRERVPVGVSVGIEPSVAEVVERVAGFVAAGYARVKLKIKPGFDLALVQAVRERWPDLLLQVDANSAYTPADTPLFKALDQYRLLLIEQPFHHEDIVDHARLQAQIDTPVCLDESIHSPEHARWALDINACKVINIKVGRVGGLTAVRQIHDLCAARGIPVWCGGMLETNIGRAVNLAIAALPNFTLPGDISASARYYHHDIATPNFVLNNDSTMSVPMTPGTGVQIDPSALAAVRLRMAEVKL